MKLFNGILIVIAVFGITACGGGDKKDDKKSEEASCNKSGTMASFTITCTKPIESFHMGNITMSPQTMAMTVNKIEIKFSSDKKVLSGKDVGSGQTSTSWDLTLEGGKKVTVTIP